MQQLPSLWEFLIAAFVGVVLLAYPSNVDGQSSNAATSCGFVLVSGKPVLSLICGQNDSTPPSAYRYQVTTSVLESVGALTVSCDVRRPGTKAVRVELKKRNKTTDALHSLVPQRVEAAKSQGTAIRTPLLDIRIRNIQQQDEYFCVLDQIHATTGREIETVLGSVMFVFDFHKASTASPHTQSTVPDSFDTVGPSSVTIATGASPTPVVSDEKKTSEGGRSTGRMVIIGLAVVVALLLLVLLLVIFLWWCCCCRQRNTPTTPGAGLGNDRALHPEKGGNDVSTAPQPGADLHRSAEPPPDEAAEESDSTSVDSCVGVLPRKSHGDLPPLKIGVARHRSEAGAGVVYRKTVHSDQQVPSDGSQTAPVPSSAQQWPERHGTGPSGFDFTRRFPAAADPSTPDTVAHYETRDWPQGPDIPMFHVHPHHLNATRFAMSSQERLQRQQSTGGSGHFAEGQLPRGTQSTARSNMSGAAPAAAKRSDSTHVPPQSRPSSLQRSCSVTLGRSVGMVTPHLISLPGQPVQVASHPPSPPQSPHADEQSMDRQHSRPPPCTSATAQFYLLRIQQPLQLDGEEQLRLEEQHQLRQQQQLQQQQQQQQFQQQRQFQQQQQQLQQLNPTLPLRAPPCGTAQQLRPSAIQEDAPTMANLSACENGGMPPANTASPVSHTANDDDGDRNAAGHPTPAIPDSSTVDTESYDNVSLSEVQA